MVSHRRVALGRVVPVGRERHAAPAGWQEPRKWAGRRAGPQIKCGANLAGSAECSGWIELQAARLFFAGFDCALAGGFGAVFFPDFAFSFAANS